MDIGVQGTKGWRDSGDEMAEGTMEWIRAKRFAGLEGIQYEALQMRINRSPLPSRKNGHGLELPVLALSPLGQEKYKAQQREKAETMAGLVRYPEGVRRRALKRLEILRGAIGLRGRALHIYMKERGVSNGAFYDYQKAYRAKGIEGLIDGMGRPKKELPQEVKDAIAAIFLQSSRPGIAFIHKILKDSLDKKAPSYDRIQKFIDEEIPHDTKVLRREGEKAYKNKCQVYAERDPETIRPMERWCADHKQIDNAISHPRNGKYIFPWLTCLYDLCSRKILSWWIAETPSGDTFTAALRRALIEYGRPEEILLDNGWDFRSRHVSGGQVRLRRGKVKISDETKGFLTQLGIKARWCLPGNPQAKPLERLFGTFQKQLSPILPAFRGGTVATRPEGLEEELKKGNKLPTPQELEALLQSWIEQYNNTPHRGRGMNGRTPNEIFATATGAREIPNPDTLTILMMRSGKKTVQRNGIQHWGASYYHPALDNFRGQKVEIREDPKEAGRVAVFSLQGAFVCWAANRPLLSHKATREEVSQVMQEKRAQKRRATQYYQDVVERTQEPDPLMRVRRIVGAGQPRPYTTQGGGQAVRLQPPIDAASREAVISKELPESSSEPKLNEWWRVDDGSSGV